MSKRRLLLLCVLGLTALSLLPAVAEAQVAKTFCVSGTSNGTPWTWNLTTIGANQTVQAPAVAVGGSATALAQGWVASIQAAQPMPPAFTAMFVRTNTDGKAYFSVSSPRNFTFVVDDCQLTGNPAGCSFNPDVVEVDEVPPDQAALPTRAIIIIVIIIIIIVIIIIIIIFRRRR